MSVQRVFVSLHSLLAADIAANAINFHVSLQPPTLEVTADADLLDQALINLVAMPSKRFAVVMAPLSSCPVATHRTSGQ